MSPEPNTVARRSGRGQGEGIRLSGGNGLGRTIRRQVLKFQLPADAPALASEITRHLPDYGYDGGSSISRVTSLYLDSDDLDLYRQSAEAPERAALIRLRWYSSPPHSPVFLELKHRNAETRQGVKQRYVLPAGTAASFRGAEAELEAVASQVRAQAGPEIEEFLAQAQPGFRAGALRPRLYVRYRRRAFQDGEEGPVRITLDTRIFMALARDWPPSARHAPSHRYPRAILEVKLEDDAPAWLEALLTEPALEPMPDFSKWTYGLSRLTG